jgi:hypothetical protein
MKKQIQSTFKPVGISSRFFLSLLMFALMVPALAQRASLNEGAAGIAIHYVGNVNNQPVFQVEFENTSEEPVQVSIKDEDGNTLYFAKIKDRRFSKKFQFEKAESDNMTLSFTLATPKEKHTQVFEVNTNVRMVRDVVVTRL